MSFVSRIGSFIITFLVIYSCKQEGKQVVNTIANPLSKEIEAYIPQS